MKEIISSEISKIVGLNKKEIENLIEIPPDSKLGDYAFPCFTLAKIKKRNPVEISKEISEKIKNKNFEKVESNRAYVNFFIDKKIIAEETLKKVLREKDKYGSNNNGKNKIIFIDMSSPNIAKPFGIGHLRSTIIGNSIAKISEFNGFKTKKINYLGDWGTQFGKLILGYSKFGDNKKLKENPIKYLLDLYVKVNGDESLEQEAREMFKKLEDGDKKALSLWKKFRELSLKYFNKIYEILGIKFDEISGESLYNNKMLSTIKDLERKRLLEESEGAKIVNLDKYGLGVCLIKKSDGATLYATRDLTAAIDRYKKYKFDRMFYEVGSEQTLHFKQIFKILELLGYNWAKECFHISHGLYLEKDGKKFATRKGKTIFMEDILDETISLAKKEIEKREKLPKTELEKRAKALALAAIFYGDLKNDRQKDIIFDVERFLSFEGDTGPYLLYSYARAKSILRKAKYNPKNKFSFFNLDEKEKNLIVHLANFPVVVEHAYKNLSPNTIANYSFQLAQTFNEFYHSIKVVGSKEEEFRLALVQSFAQVLKNSLNLLGIKTIENM